MSLSFTSEGILVGAVEHGTYSAIARLVIVAFVSNVVLRFIYARRIGIYLVAELSIGAGLHAWLRHVATSHGGRPVRRFAACVLFLLALFVTRGLDVVVSTVMVARRGHYLKKFAYVSTADLSRRAQMAGILEGVAVNRSEVYSVLRDFTRNVTTELRRLSSWPEAIGTLSDAEIAAVTLPMDTCADYSVRNPTEPRQTWMPSRFEPGMDMTKGKPFSLFSEDMLLLDFSLSQGGHGRCDAACSILIPVSVGYSVQHTGRDPITTRARRHFGVLMSRGGDFVAYDTECGLAPENVTQWLLTHKPAAHTEATSTLWYYDQHLLTQTYQVQGTAAFFLMHSHNFTRDYDVLSFGGHISQDPSGTIRSRVMSRLTKATITNGTSVGQGNVPLERQPAMTCQETRAPYHLFNSWERNNLQAIENPSMFNGEIKPMNRCVLAFEPGKPRLRQNFQTQALDNNAIVFFDPGHRGTQVCQTKLKRYLNAKSGNLGPSDLIAALQFRTIEGSGGHTPLNVRCMARNAAGNPMEPKPVFAVLGENFKHGYLTDPGLKRFNDTTDADPMSGQAVFFTLVLIPWWEVCMLVAMTLLLAVLGVWGDIAEVIAVIMYSYAFRPQPPSAQQDQDGHGSRSKDLQSRRAHLRDGFSSLPLMDATHIAAVQLGGVTDADDPEPVIEARIVPTSWNVHEGDNVSPFADDPDVNSCSETIVATGTALSQVIKKVKSTSMRRQGGYGIV